MKAIKAANTGDIEENEKNGILLPFFIVVHFFYLHYWLLIVRGLCSCNHNEISFLLTK